MRVSYRFSVVLTVCLSTLVQCNPRPEYRDTVSEESQPPTPTHNSENSTQTQQNSMGQTANDTHANEKPQNTEPLPSQPAPLTAEVNQYYATIDTTLQEQAFKQALHRLISPHTVLEYYQLLQAFNDTDANQEGCQNQTWADIYSNHCFSEKDTCTTAPSEGKCINREHTWPKSWFHYPSNKSPAYSDLRHIFPVDAFVNTMRFNYPYGEVDKAIQVSQNGSKLGKALPALGYDAYDTTVFEPVSAVKGDLARIYFYISTCYMDEDSAWISTGATDHAHIKPWQETMLKRWHQQDPVDATERHRNDAVFKWQKNRNPFVDHPEWVNKISDF